MAGPTPSADASPRASLLRHAAGAVGVVVLGAVAFWGVGTLTDRDDTPVVADAPEAEPDEPDETHEPDETPEPPADDPEPEPAPEPEEPEEDEPDEEPEPDEPDVDDAEDEDAPEDETADEPERAVAPGEVTIQVLDGFKTDGGSAADGVAQQLSGAGYDVVARNQAIDYAETTVLYNAGHQAAAEQVAAELGGAAVREQPGNLSTAVALHVVVGADRA